MKKEELEKYVSELSPEMQEKARECKDMQELNAFLAENDVELSEDALSAVAGGCSSSDKYEEIEVERYKAEYSNSWTVRFYKGSRVDGALMTKDNHGGIHYYIITVSKKEPVSPEQYQSMIKEIGMVKV